MSARCGRVTPQERIGGLSAVPKEASMSRHAPSDPTYLDHRPGQPLIAIPWQDGNEEVTRYFVDEEAAREFGASQSGAGALAVLGAWSDLDWDEFVEEI